MTRKIEAIALGFVAGKQGGDASHHLSHGRATRVGQLDNHRSDLTIDRNQPALPEAVSLDSFDKACRVFYWLVVFEKAS